MNANIIIRNETIADHQAVERLTREAFYNLYMPGCTEHYLVHVMRDHEDFVPELDFVLELDGRVIGNIMYTRAWLTDQDGNQKTILIFGPICIAPEYQRRGYGRLLIEHSLARARELGYDVVVIFGSPSNYVSRDFQSCKKYNIAAENGRFPAAMLAKELVPGALSGKKWIYRDSPAMAISEEAAQAYDDTFPPMEKKHTPTQEEFYILSQAYLD